MIPTVRRSGEVRHARGFGVHDHLCWGYEDPVEFSRRVAEFLGDGLALGQRICLVAADVGVLLDTARSVPGFDHALSTGAARVADLVELYGPDEVIDPAAQVEAYAAETELAVREGFTGFRVAAEATPLVRSPAQLGAFARYEHRVDRYMATQPLSAMCAYDRRVLGDATISQLASLHPNTSNELTPFRLYAGGEAAATLDGELDIDSLELLSLALERADLGVEDGEIVLDGTGLSFVDHRNLSALAAFAGRLGATAVLRTSYALPARLIEILDLEGVRVESIL
jgi:hypothetical protein